MCLKEVARIMNNNEYGDEITKEQEEILKAEGIVVLFGASDDLSELRGAINDEVGAYDGVVLYFDEEGKLLNNAYDADELNDLAKPYGLKNIKVIANYREYPVFRYETEIQHEKFNIIEDGNIYCEGICFYFKDLVG